jgi:hypothetical protein
MGLFDKIGDFLGDVVDGVLDFTDDVLGIDLRKILDKDWVRYGLMAASLFAGGVGIVNGLVKGTTQFASTKSFSQAFVAGIEGFKTGIMSPLKTSGQLLKQGSDALGSVFGGAPAGTPPGTSPADIASLTSGTVEPSLAQRAYIDAAQGASQADNLLAKATGPEQMLKAQNPGVDPTSISLKDSFSGGGMSDVVGQNSALPVPQYDPAMSSSIYDKTAKLSPQYGTPPGASDLTRGVTMPTPQMTQAGLPEYLGGGMPNPMTGGGGGGDFLSNFFQGAKDFASSPAGMMTIANTVSGYAQGAALEERWNMMERENRRRRESFTGFGQRAPRSFTEIPSLRQLRDRTQQARERGMMAQAKYGY